MRNRMSCLALSLFLVALAANSGDIKLPEPQTAGGAPIFDTLRQRTSAPGNAFPTGEISDADLSTLLWAASGQNRPDKGWTVPFAMGVEPYCRIYVVSGKGVHLYSWKDHSLKAVTGEDVRAKISPQPFVKTAACIFVFVTDHASLEKNGRGKDRWQEWTDVAVGAMTQNLYLAAEALNIGGRYAAMMDADFVKKTLDIPAGEKAVCIFPLGKL